MTFSISTHAARRPLFSLVLFAVLAVFGAFAFRALPITRTPNIDVPVIEVTVGEPGASPTELESQVTKRIEDAVAVLPGVRHAQSIVTDGISQTYVEFRIEVPTDRARDDVQDAVAKIRSDLPPTIDEPMVESIDVVSQPIRTYAVTAPGMTLEGVSWYVENTVMRRVQTVPGVGRLTRTGGVRRELQLTLDPDRLASLGLTAGGISRQLRDTNVDLAGGRAELGDQEQVIRTLGQASDRASLGARRIVLPGGRALRLDDFGTLTDGYAEPRNFTRLNGAASVVSFSVYRAKGASDVDVAARIDAALNELHAARSDVRFTVIDDVVQSTLGNYHSAMESLIEGAALAVVVVLLFLRDWRATLVVAVTLPLSILPTFLVMQLMGFSLNMISLLAITLVTGVLVDDAIVEIENIVRHMRMGRPPFDAAVEAAQEIGLAVVAITLTIVAIFAPVSFMGGVPGQWFKQFGLTVTAAVLASLLVVRLLTPMMAAHILHPPAFGIERDFWLLRKYETALAAGLQRPGLTLIVAVLVFGLSIWSVSLLPTGFIPPIDNGRSVLAVELPPGATLADTQRRTDAAALELRQIPEVASVFVTGGATPTGMGPEVRKATLIIRLTPKTARIRSQKQVETEVTHRLQTIPDLRAWYVNDRGDRELSLTLLSDDPRALDRAVAGLESAMRRLPGFFNVAAGSGAERPELSILPREADAARIGVSTLAISNAVRLATIGDLDSQLAKLRIGDRLVPIHVQADLSARRDLNLLATLPVINASGVAVPLGACADLRLGSGPSSIERFDRRRRVVIGADLSEDMALGSALDQVHALRDAQMLPAGVQLQDYGDAELMVEVLERFQSAMGAGLLVVIAVLVLLLGGVFQSFTILLSLPLSIGGVIIALLVTRNAISMPVMIGILMLLGIVAKNAIMLVDVAVKSERCGMPRREAILQAGHKRARPIVMTTIAMVAGMAPSAFGLGEGGEFRAPMAIAVIGGLLLATVLSLVFVPSLYSLMAGLSDACADLRHGRFRMDPINFRSAWRMIVTRCASISQSRR